MLYTQDISGCLAARIGSAGLSEARYLALLEKAEEALASLREAYATSTLALLRVPEERADLEAMAGPAERFARGARDVLLFGTGGSSLGAQALAQLVGFGTAGFDWAPGRPRLHFFDNLDPLTLNQALKRIDVAAARFLVVSKSGGTPETASQMLAALDALARAGRTSRAREQFMIVTEPKPSLMRRFAEQHGIRVLDHPPTIGGRYSVLTIVGLLPAHLMGLDGVKFRDGALQVLRPILDGATAADVAPAVGAAVAVGLAEERGMAVSVLMPYLDRLERFAMWYRQLWAESLGKGGQGTTPVRALGPVDQHSQVQLYLDGPRDKLFTLFLGAVKGQGVRLTRALTGGDADLAYLEGRTVGDLLDAEQSAMVETFIRNGRPVRVFHLPQLEEATLGALLMHFMLETIIAGRLMGVDPFDQPAVEQGKVLTRQYLMEGRG